MLPSRLLWRQGISGKVRGRMRIRELYGTFLKKEAVEISAFGNIFGNQCIEMIDGGQ